MGAGLRRHQLRRRPAPPGRQPRHRTPVRDPAGPVLRPADFPWVAPVETNWKVIRAELDAVLAHRAALPNFQDISTDQYQLTDDDRWKTYFFYGYGFRSDANCARCPETTRLIEAIPGMETAMFSILAPGKRIPPHDGPYKGVLRYHLGLSVPEAPVDASASGSVPRSRGWREGGSLVFDDTYEHEAWNETDETRVVLFVDVVRPLRQPMRAINAGSSRRSGTRRSSRTPSAVTASGRSASRARPAEPDWVTVPPCASAGSSSPSSSSSSPSAWSRPHPQRARRRVPRPSRRPSRSPRPRSRRPPTGTTSPGRHRAVRAR